MKVLIAVPNTKANFVPNAERKRRSKQIFSSKMSINRLRQVKKDVKSRRSLKNRYIKDGGFS